MRISLTNSSKLALVSVVVSTGVMWSSFMAELRSAGRVRAPTPTWSCRLLAADFGTPGVLERIHHGFFHTHLFQMSLGEAAPQNIIDSGAEVLRGGYRLRKFLERVQTMV